ncbi:MAG: tetraacyldisaccharide 4'-kinase [Candidatus Adiutrix sp.]|jgi:tetraacyldisaccharide 4'-kinase|nr:tetraacyldisaccharide 4'-kinase [Candidatus Adiutrix sp.]
MNYNAQPYGRYISAGLGDRLRRRMLDNWRGQEPYAALRPLGALYGWGVRLHRKLYGPLFHSEKAAAPVISIGNLTVGGSGKTPMCLALSRLLMDRDRRPAILSRGYGRRAPRTDAPLIVGSGRGEPSTSPLESGDEPWLMASQLPGLRVVVDADRVRAARTAVEHLKADLLILDDGHQQLRLAADCRVLLVPARNPFGNGAVLPAGPLREPLAAHRRADVLVSAGAERPAPEVMELAGGRPVFAAEYHSTGWRPLGSREALPPEALSGRRVFAFCGLGRPESFERSLQRLKVDIRYFVALPDHFEYGREALDGLGLGFMSTGAEFLVTTAKDAVKIPADFPLPVMVLQMEMAISRADEFVDTVLRIAKR